MSQQTTIHQLACFNVETSVINKFYLNLQLQTFNSNEADLANSIVSVVTTERKDLFKNKLNELIILKEKLKSIDNLTYYIKTTRTTSDTNRLLSNIVTKDSLKQSIIQVYQDILINCIINCEISAYITEYTLKSYLKSDYSIKIGWINRACSKQLQEFYTSHLEQPYSIPLQCQINPFTLLLSSSSSDCNDNKPDKKHDHAFVIIIHNITGKITHVVDLWQIFILPHYEPFIGTMDEYINFLKLPGALKVEKITKEDVVFSSTGKQK